MVSKTPHCVKHTKFIPSCKDCKDLRDAWLIKKANQIVEKKVVKKTTKRPSTNHHPLMPLDKKGNPRLTKKYVHFNLTPNKFPGIPQLFNEMDELGYTMFHQVETKGQDAFFIFKKDD